MFIVLLFVSVFLFNNYPGATELTQHNCDDVPAPKDLSHFESLPTEMYKEIFSWDVQGVDIINLSWASKTMNLVVIKYLLNCESKKVISWRNFMSNMRDYINQCEINYRYISSDWDTLHPQSKSIHLRHVASGEFCFLSSEICMTRPKDIERIKSQNISEDLAFLERATKWQNFAKKHVCGLHFEISDRTYCDPNTLKNYRFRNRGLLPYENFRWFDPMAFFSNLQSLCLSNHNIHWSYFEALSKLPLKILNLENSLIEFFSGPPDIPQQDELVRIQNKVFKNIGTIESLIYLNLKGFCNNYETTWYYDRVPKLSYDKLIHLTNLKNLKYLSIDNVFSDKNDNPEINNLLRRVQPCQPCEICLDRRETQSIEIVRDDILYTNSHHSNDDEFEIFNIFSIFENSQVFIGKPEIINRFLADKNTGNYYLSHIFEKLKLFIENSEIINRFLADKEIRNYSIVEVFELSYMFIGNQEMIEGFLADKKIGKFHEFDFFELSQMFIGNQEMIDAFVGEFERIKNSGIIDEDELINLLSFLKSIFQD